LEDVGVAVVLVDFVSVVFVTVAPIDDVVFPVPVTVAPGETVTVDPK
jgi:hypothetical protein